MNLTAAENETPAEPIAGLIDDPDQETAFLSELAELALARARRAGADQAEATLSASLSREAAVRLGEVETLSEAGDRSLQITVYCGGCSGSASTGDLRRFVVEQTVDRALSIARHTQPDPASGLAEAQRLAREFPDLALWHPEDIDMARLIDRAQRIEQAGRELDPRIVNSEGASVSCDFGLGVYANSHGFIGAGKGTRYGQSCVLVAADEGGMQRDYDWDSARRLDRLASPEATGQAAARRTLDRLGARRIPTGKAQVLFAPEVARGLIGHLVGAVSGGNLYRRSSFLLDACGQSLMPAWANLVEYPRQSGGVRSASFDNEGVATADAPLIESGVLTRYVLGSYSARRLGLETTANAGGVRNLIFQPGQDDQPGLIRHMQRGLVVTEVMGQGVNLVNGDYSRGASGFWVEDGEIAWPVEEITIAGNLRDMFASLVAAGSDLDTRSNIQTPSLLIDSMMVAGD